MVNEAVNWRFGAVEWEGAHMNRKKVHFNAPLVIGKLNF